jgi:hypothetical protein
MRVAGCGCNRCDSLGLGLGDSHSDGRLSRAFGSRSHSWGDGVGRRCASWGDGVAGGLAVGRRRRGTSWVHRVAGVALLGRRNLRSVDWVDWVHRVAVGGCGSAWGWLGALVTASVNCRGNGDGNVRWRQVGRVDNRLVISCTNRGRAWHKACLCRGVSGGDVLRVSWGRHWVGRVARSWVDRDTGRVLRRRARRRVGRVARGWVDRVA